MNLTTNTKSNREAQARGDENQTSLWQEGGHHFYHSLHGIEGLTPNKTEGDSLHYDRNRWGYFITWLLKSPILPEFFVAFYHPPPHHQGGTLHDTLCVKNPHKAALKNY
ncbi:MAG: hypothetical protein JSW15_05345 [Deltaproteobacteria bacterium]|nr:MAG: hypothetical protein JSW15_05345 [Deltaproteobacteria bacterium]